MHSILHYLKNRNFLLYLVIIGKKDRSTIETWYVISLDAACWRKKIERKKKTHLFFARPSHGSQVAECLRSWVKVKHWPCPQRWSVSFFTYRWAHTMTCFPVKKNKKDERRTMIYGRSFLINNHPALVYLHNQLSGVRLYDFSSNLHFPFGEFFSCMAIFL